MDRKRSKARTITPKAREGYYRETLADCVAFLQKWEVTEGYRSETLENAFIAITELERVTRAEFDAFVNRGSQDKLPF